MKIAFVGCGFVIDFYLMTVGNHPELEIVGIFDKLPERSETVAKRYGIAKIYPSLEALLTDPQVELVVNLTNPRAHYEITKKALLAGKHVYSEKPLAMDFNEANEVATLSRARGLGLASAPCNSLSSSAQTLWRAIRRNEIGPVRLVYAQLDDGMIPRQPHQTWKSWSGCTWPAQDEFEVGCTLEHAGYLLTWLAMFFGPARSVEATSRCLISDKRIPLTSNAPDFSTALLEFDGGVVARLTCSILAPTDHSIKVVGESGVLSVDDCWFYGSPVFRQRMHPRTGVLERRHGLALVRTEEWQADYHAAASYMDYARGIAELASSVLERRPCRLGAELSLHVTELALAIQHPTKDGARFVPRTRFDSVAPMPWAEPA